MRQNVPIRANRIKYIALYIGALTARSRNIKPLCSNVHIQYDAASHSVHGYDNGVEQALMSVHVSAGSNVITYLRNGLEQGWTASGNKGIGLQVITVFLD